jgi:hypothetical protein
VAEEEQHRAGVTGGHGPGSVRIPARRGPDLVEQRLEVVSGCRDVRGGAVAALVGVSPEAALHGEWRPPWFIEGFRE